MREPQEICDVEHEQILERVAAVDVAKASGMVCVREPQAGRPDRRRSLVWEVPATTNAVLELAGACPESCGTWVTIHGEL